MTPDGGVLVALSGGVDSAVALLRLAAEGRRVEAAIVELLPGDDPRSCCGPTAVARARAAADASGVRLHVLDEKARFARTVVEPFVAAYLAGETPNPCVRCNPERLASLVGLADELGLARVATGHYARLVTSDGATYLARAVDRAKDQSYMLSAVPPAVLERLEFPLGGLTKPEVRALAREAGLSMAEQPESQEVCFALEGYRAFLEERGVAPRPGPIVDRGGRVLGEHDGQWRFTIGQRRGLRVSGDAPLYVVERRPAANEVVVGGAEQLATDEVILREVVDRGITGGGDLTVQLRYRSAAASVATVEPGAAGELLVRLAAPFAAPAPGQTAVFYRGGVVVGAGVIDGRSWGARGARSAERRGEYDSVS
jgi:tRNA-specific 2-thiouridylase